MIILLLMIEESISFYFRPALLSTPWNWGKREELPYLSFPKSRMIFCPSPERSATSRKSWRLRNSPWGISCGFTGMRLMIVQQRLILLHQNDQLDLIFEGQEGGPVDHRVSLLLVRVPQGGDISCRILSQRPTYQDPEGLIPALSQRSISATWVPDLSPRLMKRTPFSAIFFRASVASLHPLDPCRIIRRADDDKVVVHEIDSFRPKPFLHEFLFEGLRMDHHKVDTALCGRYPGPLPVPAPTWRTRIPVSFSKSVSRASTMPASMGPMVLERRMNLLPCLHSGRREEGTKQADQSQHKTISSLTTSFHQFVE